MSNIAILDKTSCINLVCTLWSGRRRLRPEDYFDTEQLPPEDLASLGSLKLCDPKALTKLNSIKRAAERDLERLCVRFLGGYATDKNNVDVLVNKLLARKQEFDEQAKVFVASLQAEYEQWAAKYPKWAHVTRKALPDPGYVSSRLTFEFQVFQVGLPSGENSSAVAAGLLSAAGGLSGQLFNEIESEALYAWSRSYEGKDAVGQKALRPIRAIREKLDALRFIDSRIVPMIEKIDTVLSSLPTAGKVEGNEFMALVGLLKLLGDSDQMVRFGASPSHNDQGVSDGDDTPTESSVAGVSNAGHATDDEPVAELPLTSETDMPPEASQEEQAPAGNSHWF